MTRYQVQTFVCVLCLFSSYLIAPARAELEVIEDAEGQQGLTVFRMTVTPAAEPVPALKHRLQLRPHEYKPGNAATYYLRANAENGLSGTWKGVRKEFGEAIDNGWYSSEIPLGELPLDQVRKAAASFDDLVSNYIVPASCRQGCDWGYHLTELRGSDVWTFLLPGVQQSRAICRLLALRTRLAIAESRYDDAIDHIRMNFRLARNVGQEPVIVCGLVGLAEAGVTCGTTIDLIAAPGSPNLYWALSELPRPIVDLREAIRLEMSTGVRVFPALMDVETSEHSPAGWARLIADALKEYETLTASSPFQGISLAQNDLLRRMASAGLSLAIYPEAKQRLVHSGMDAAQVEKMPVGQVVLMDAAYEYQRIADEMEKWTYVPYPLAKKRIQRAENELFGNRQFNDGLGAMIADLLLPAIQAARTAQMRLQWQMNSLRVVEALRMHAAETGKFPASLDDVKVVPVPKNPITEQPYVYRLDGETAVLELPFSDGMPGVAWRFELRLAVAPGSAGG